MGAGLTSLRDRSEYWLYTRLAKPLFFLADPETAHDRISDLGRLLGSNSLTRGISRLLFDFKSPALNQTVAGIAFRNPIGLAAGFDKNARLLKILPAVGFGFAEVGSITARPCAGNPRPRLRRLTASRAIWVNYGLKSEGSQRIGARLEKIKPDFPVGISLAPTNDAQTVDFREAIADYLISYRRFAALGAYTVLNLSCPNTCNDQPFQDPEYLKELLDEVKKVPSGKPLFLKVSPDLSLEKVEKLLPVAERGGVRGFIIANLTKKRENEALKESDLPVKGGVSGKVVQRLSDRMLAHLARESRGRFVFIGCGGVFNADDAYLKITLGASLVQLITGLIYEGPQLISMINQGILRRLERDGFTEVSQAIGSGLKE